ncbi:uncharacterized protein LOC106134174 [Amyelois transitella]|uniref:uncharacterized protein LOC106134174 n=1 Tax=Amyelois transitella TaxID=680683 RepID=UPI00067B39A8|nr:uncharacterized protein LOC106134174 [Amyelois transitella]
MDQTLLMLAIILFFNWAEALKCYYCEPLASNYQDIRYTKPCEKFDMSDMYVVDCDSSTMCFKTQVDFDFGTGVTTTYQRGCAAQTLNGDQRNIGGKWTHVTKIYEVYEEGCKVEKDSERLTTGTHCYCRGDYCNGAFKINSHTIIVIVSLILLIV